MNAPFPDYVRRPIDSDWAMPSAHAAAASRRSLLRVSGFTSIAIAVFCILYFAAEFARVAM